MSDPIVYVDHSRVVEGKHQEVETAVTKLVEFIERREPQLIAYGFYFEGDRMAVVAVHPDSASLARHLEIGGPEFRKLADLIELESIEVYGRPTAEVVEQLEQKLEMLGHGGRVTVHDRSAGFARLPV